MNTIRAERVGDTVEFFSNLANFLFISSVDRSALAAAQLTEALLQPNTEAPFTEIGETQLEALSQLSTIF